VDRNLRIGIACFVAFVVTYALLILGPIVASNYLKDPGMQVQLPLLAIVGIMALLAALAVVSVAFSLAGLSDRTQALGLPEGSVRAVIALSLIVLFAITSVYLYSSLAVRDLKNSPALAEKERDDFVKNLRNGELVTVTSSGDEKKTYVVVYRLGSQASEDFAKQLFTVIGTLMTAVASFYFATRAAAGPAPKTSVSSPTITGVSPKEAALGTAPISLTVRIAGSGLQLANSVKFVQGTNAVPVSGVISNDAMIQCALTLDPSLAKGAYDIVITNSDGGETKLPQGFTLT
jgi:hypothetical protein